MEIEQKKQSKENIELIETIANKMAKIEETLQPQYDRINSLKQDIKDLVEEIKPVKEKLCELAEIKAGVASKRSRVKYFPEFATRNFDDSKDAEFIEFVKSKIE